MIKIEEPILHVLKTLQTKGKAYIVGGYLRDKFLNIPPHDIDVVVDYPLDIVKELFPSLHGTESGLAFGIGRFQKNDFSFEISSHPGHDLTEMLSWRDYSINTLVHDGVKLIDLHQSLHYLEKKVISPVCSFEHFFDHNKKQPFVRAIRLSAHLGFELAPELITFLSGSLDIFHETTLNRLQEEGYRILESPYPSFAFHYLQSIGLLSPTPLIPLEKEPWTDFHDFPQLRLVMLANIYGLDMVKEFVSIFHLSNKMMEKVSYLHQLVSTNQFPAKPTTLNQFIQIKQHLLAKDPESLAEFYNSLRTFMNKKHDS